MLSAYVATVDIQTRIDDIICEIVLTDSEIRDTPFSYDDGIINRDWKDLMYVAIDRRERGLGLHFIEWCTNEEILACAEHRLPRLPWQKPLRYPVLYVRWNGQVDVGVG